MRWMTWWRPTCTGLMLALGLGAALPAAAAYPDKPVTMVVAFAPGGTNDILARLVSNKLQALLKQPFIVENKAGAASIIGSEHVARARPDGYTLYLGASGALTINPAVYRKLPYDPVKDFTPIGVAGTFPLVAVVNAASPAQTLADLPQVAKDRSDGALNHGVASSTFQLAAELYSRASGLKFFHINYKGTGPVVTALMGNEIDVAFVDIAAALPQIQGGRLRALAVTTAERSPLLPDVPTVAESNAPGYDVPIWSALVAPAGLPSDVQATLADALRQALADPEVIAQIRKLGMEPGEVDPQGLGKRIATDIDRWRGVAQAAGIQLD